MEEYSTSGSEVLLPPLLGFNGIKDRLPLWLVLLADFFDLLLHHGVQCWEPPLKFIHTPCLQLAGRQKKRHRHRYSHHPHIYRDFAAHLMATTRLPAREGARVLLQTAALSECRTSLRILACFRSFYRYIICSVSDSVSVYNNQCNVSFPHWAIFLVLHFAGLERKYCTEKEQKWSSLPLPFPCN